MEVSFSVGYHTNWGQNVYVVGDLEELGAWKAEKAVKMWWTQGHVWATKATLPLNVLFHYKYLVLGENEYCRWEVGPNRSSVSTANSHVDTWDHSTVTLALFHPQRQSTEVMHINGDLAPLGRWDSNGPVPMSLEAETRLLPTEVQGRCWAITFAVPRTVQSFAYKYLLMDSATDSAEWEREPNRELCMSEGEEAPSHIERLDMNFVGGIVFDKVTDFQIFIGPYPQSSSDIETLARAGITAVVNLQSRRDFTYRRINWPALQQVYAGVNIEAVHIPVGDFDHSDLVSKLPHAAEVIDELYGNDKVIYVHCTAGMGRAPAAVVYYLVKYHNFSVESAIQLVRDSRTVAVPNEAAIREALEVA